MHLCELFRNENLPSPGRRRVEIVHLVGLLPELFLPCSPSARPWGASVEQALRHLARPVIPTRRRTAMP